ncbi:hypothetical protein AAKU52_000712 [Pedobacter sp. CG_S7]|uniref:PKD-like domain-containing protein n=1 Tax=Pedobacter sp. CG_S7 TaxID=3143930 RepID=UPI003392F379
MNIKNYLTTVLLLTVLLAGCKKDKEVLPEVTFSIAEDVVATTVNTKITFKAAASNEKAIQHEWRLNNEVKSTNESYEFTPTKSGKYIIGYTASNAAGTFTRQYTVNASAPIKPITPESSLYVTKLIEYLPAPGQFINKAPGNRISAESILGKKGMVTLGAWGGYIVLGFDHTVINQLDKEDIIIYGNAGLTNAEPGIVWVMQDENGNGIADDTWYEIAGSEFGKDGYIRNYEVTYTKPNPATAKVAWKDNKGNSGFVETNVYHKQSYFPEWATDVYTLKGTLLPSRNINMTSPTNITSAPFGWGYADNTAGGDKIDIANAIDKEGKKINLEGIDFIKIQTSIQANMGWLGEFSTEVLGVADMNLR